MATQESKGICWKEVCPAVNLLRGLLCGHVTSGSKHTHFEDEQL